VTSLLWAAALLASAVPARASAGVVISSAILDPHELAGAVMPMSSEFKPLTAFPEKLIFDMAWGLIGVGQATLEIEDIVEFNGRPAYHIVSRALSNHFCDGFYKVRDLNESWMDARTLSSLGYSKRLREGHFFRDEWILNQNGKWVGKRAGRDGNFTVAVGTEPIGVQDILSSMYFLRGKTLNPGTDIVLDVNTRQNWPLVIRVVKKERVKTPAGRFDAYLVEPSLRQEGIFVQKGNRLQIWLSDDPKHVPVMMKVEVFFGSITARLAKMVY
jgi:hypothetical protein